jgi:hypothetical protein
LRRISRAVSLSALFAALIMSSSTAATLHPIGNFKRPIFVTSDPGDHERLLVVEREGRVVETGPGGTRTYADLSSLVACCESERGLLSIAPAPDFHSSGRFYAAYTGKPAAGGLEGDIHVDSFRPDPQAAGQLIREPILSVAHSQEANHNGGQLQFGPDGHLYVSLGDGGGGGDPFENGQDTEELLAKILRIDPRPGQSPAYAIPAGNPFAAGPGRDEIWAYGLRNPWRFSFDYATGDLVIADVGQDTREEVDFAPAVGGVVSGAGANYGWSCREGFIAYTSPAANCAGKSGFTDPVFDYPHEDPGGGGAHGCSIIGGYVVRDQSVADLYGRYVYSDYCTGEIRSLLLPSASSGRASDDHATGLSVSEPTSFGEDSCGRVYVASAEGPVYRLEGPAPATCPQPVLPIAVKRPKRPRLLLGARRLRPSRARFRVKARLEPCGDNAGRRVTLRRHGHQIARKRLDRRCRARFGVRVGRRTALRAVVRLAAGERLRSNRVVLRRRGLRRRVID